MYPFNKDFVITIRIYLSIHLSLYLAYNKGHLSVKLLSDLNLFLKIPNIRPSNNKK